MAVSSEELVVGGACAVLALLLARRIAMALRDGEIPLYRTRRRKAELGNAKFAALIAINLFLLLLMAFIAADLLLGLGLRYR